MRISAFLIPLLLFLAFAPHAGGQAPAGVPMMSSVDPGSARAGDILTIQGVNLGPESVAAVYLTDGKTDVKTAILEQSATSLRIRIPRDAKPGRLALMVLTAGKEPRLLEEPVKVTVEPDTTSRL